MNRNRIIAVVLVLCSLVASLGYSVVGTFLLGRTAWLGMQFTRGVENGDELPPILASIPGFRPGSVTQLYPGTPADLGGIRLQDRILEIDGIPIGEHERLQQRSRLLRVGDSVELRVQRGESEYETILSADTPLHASGYMFSLFSSYVVALVFGVTGLLVLFRKPGDRRAFLFFLVCLLISIISLSATTLVSRMLAGYGINDPQALGAVEIALLALLAIGGSLIWPMLLHLALIFPRPRPVLTRFPEMLKWIYFLPILQLLTLPGLFVVGVLSRLLHDVIADLIVIAVAAVAIGFFMRNIRRASRSSGPWTGIVSRPVDGVAGLFALTLAVSALGDLIGDLTGLSRAARTAVVLAPILGSLLLYIAIVVLGYPIAACGALYRSYRESGPEERAQLRWPLWGTIVAVAGLAALSIVSSVRAFVAGGSANISTMWLEGLGKGFYLLIPFSFAFAILKYRLLDIDLVLRKTVVYSALTGMVLLTYLLLAGGLGGLVVRTAGIESEWVIVGATVVVAAALVPVRNVVQSFVDRRVFRQKYDYSQALSRMTRELPTSADERSAVELVVDEVQRAMRSRAVVLFVRRDPGRMRAVAKVGLPDDALTRLTVDPHELDRTGVESLIDVDSVGLTPSSRRLMRKARAVKLLPIRRDGRLLAAMTFGAKLSGEPFDREDGDFARAVAERVAVTLDNLRLRQRGAEVDMALEIQRHLLPSSLPRIPGYDLAAHWRPSRTVAGDYYDVLPLDGDRVGLCIADATGKGMPAALMMSNLQAAVRALATGNGSTGELCRRLNDIIAGSAAAGKFISFFFAVLDPLGRKMRYSNAGHNAPILVRRGGSAVRLTEGGMVLGAFPEREYREGELALAAGDRLLLFTDGVSEAIGADGEEFGEERLLQLVRSCGRARAEEIERAISDSVDAHSPGELEDDATLLILVVE